MHVKNEDGSESIFLNKEEDIDAASASQKFYQLPDDHYNAKNSSQLGGRIASSAISINHRPF